MYKKLNNISIASLLEGGQYSDIIDWSDTGLTFIIKDKYRFEKEVIKSVYGHQSLKNFVRQLHKYGFNKVRKRRRVVTLDGLGVEQASNQEVTLN